jgi:hypothetical protein
LWAARAGLIVSAVGCAPAAAEDASEGRELVGAIEEAGKIRFVSGVGFADGCFLEEVTVTPALARPGEAVMVAARGRGCARGAELSVGLRAPRAASFEDPRDREATRVDPRDRWGRAAVADGLMEVRLVLPSPWHPRSVVIEGELLQGDARIEATSGPRSAGGRAALALVPVETRPTEARALRAEVAPRIDGALVEAIWQRRGDALVESLGGEPLVGPASEVWFAWDEARLYVAARLPDEDLWGTFSADDDPIYEQEVFEIMAAGTGADGVVGQYVELGVSPRGVTFDASFKKYREGDPGWSSAWEVAVLADGTVNDGGDRDRGWAVEAAIPWAELCAYAAAACPPQAGQRVRVNVFRIERQGRRTAIGMALSPTRTPDFHAWANAGWLELE